MYWGVYCYKCIIRDQNIAQRLCSSEDKGWGVLDANYLGQYVQSHLNARSIAQLLQEAGSHRDLIIVYIWSAHFHYSPGRHTVVLLKLLNMNNDCGHEFQFLKDTKILLDSSPPISVLEQHVGWGFLKLLNHLTSGQLKHAGHLNFQFIMFSNVHLVNQASTLGIVIHTLWWVIFPLVGIEGL